MPPQDPTDDADAADPRARNPAARRARIAFLLLLALTTTELLWETLLAPLRPGGSWLALKALPLALLLWSARRGLRRPLQWIALLLPFYFAEAIVRAWSESGRHAAVAALATVLTVAAFVALLAWMRKARR
jgi:uncharacterized membrane protein